MALLSNMSDTGFKDCIANNIPSRAFRYATESKNVLNTAGAMYVGTGIKRTTTMMLADGITPVSYDSYITAVLQTPQNDGYTLKTIHIDGTQYVLTYLGTNDPVYVDANNYLANTGSLVEGYFPCWTNGTNYILPKVIG